MKRLIIFLIAFFLVACQAQPSLGPYTNVGPAELNSMLASKDFVFVNVHIPYEGDIAGTDLSIPYDQITEPDNLALLPADKGAQIVLYCRSGRMSEIAANALVGLGYTNVWNLDGGMIEWERQGFEIVGR
ncbi:MAG TPA: rhodanese-like domain-containing protein [Anaerolineales bacterium]|nr:rhodanese-like domain-containing protein [Anaerolineales bacterium]